MENPKIKKFIPVIVAVVFAIIVASIYISSGKGNQDLNTRILEANENVNKVEIKNGDAGDKTTKVTCANGTSYDVYYPSDATDFTANAKVKCEQ